MPYGITVLPATRQRLESRLCRPAEAGTRFSDPEEMQGWVDLCYVKADRPEIEPATCKSQVQVQRSTASPPCRLSVNRGSVCRPLNYGSDSYSYPCVDQTRPGRNWRPVRPSDPVPSSHWHVPVMGFVHVQHFLANSCP